MHSLKGAWAGQTFSVSACNDSGGRKARIRRSKEERKSMAETFIKTYQKSNNGNFPSLTLTHKNVGGSFYTVREIVREIIQENRVLGPATLPSEEQNGEIPFLSFPVEPHSSLSLKDAIHYQSTINGDILDSNGKLHSSRFGKHQSDDEQVVVVTSSDLIGQGRLEDEQPSQYIVKSAGSDGRGLTAEKVEASLEPLYIEASSLKESVRETEEFKVSNTGPTLNQSDDEQVVVVTSDIIEHGKLEDEQYPHYIVKSFESNERCLTVETFERSQEPIYIESSLVKESVGETGELEVSNTGPTHSQSDDDQVVVATTDITTQDRLEDEQPSHYNVNSSESDGRCLTVEPMHINSSSVKESEGETEVEVSKAGPTCKIADVLVEKFPLRPISMAFDDWDEKLISQPNGSTLEVNAEMMKEAVESSLQSSSTSSTATATDIKLTHSSSKTQIREVEWSTESNREEEGDSISNMKVEKKGEKYHLSPSSPLPLDRLNLETWKGTAAETSTKHENNPLLALFKSFISAIVNLLH
ncbi:hypothetical protein DM860_014248 [Cuscuta australis]|uniref:AT3G52170-like helix-turn-helix domain-containing protein n=1 Tax=Cuscuta australis TaxID=267555 RepID=A0A328DDG0_9ASTE|nr:hypothetical protein DM860_014248 [Cuscuta australis]